MKKLSFVIVLLSCLITACGSSDSYSIKGTISGIEDGTVVTLKVFDYFGLESLDSAVVKNGKFSINGRTDTTQMAALTYIVDGEMLGCQFFLEKGSIVAEIDALSGRQFFAGTPNNDVYQLFYEATDQLEIEANEIEDKIRITLSSQGDCSSLYKQMDELQERYKALLSTSIIDNADKVYAYSQLIDNYSMFEPEEVLTMLEALAPTFGSDLSFNQLTTMINAQLSTSLGQQYIDFEAPILNKKDYSKKVSLSSYVGKNKIILLDFWASWCSPCMNEVPNLKAAYKRFKSKGFEIISVSVDDDVEAWQKAISDNSMNWVQLWNGNDEDVQNSPAMRYFVTAIPSTFLIDSDGTIIGRNLRGSELEEALEDYFK